jgi:hypothetical protein
VTIINVCYFIFQTISSAKSGKISAQLIKNFYCQNQNQLVQVSFFTLNYSANISEIVGFVKDHHFEIFFCQPLLEKREKERKKKIGGEST